MEDENIPTSRSTLSLLDLLEITRELESNCVGSTDFEGLRVTPRCLFFKEVFDTDQQHIVFTVQNVSKNPLLLKIHEPKSLGFKMEPILRERFLSPGISIKTKITYLNLRKPVERSFVSIYVNGKLMEYPITVEKAKTKLVLKPRKINFGMVDVGSAAAIHYLTLKNDGGIPSKYSFDLGANDLDLVVRPMKGLIRAYSSLEIRVEFVGMRCGHYHNEFWLRSSQNPIRIPVKVKVLEPHLCMSHPNMIADLTLVDFPPTYFGTKRQESFVIRNVSASPNYFLVLGEINNKSHVLKEAAELEPWFNMFKVIPEDGQIKSFGGVINTVEFRPNTKYLKKTKWKHLESPGVNEFLIFARILRVQCIDSTIESDKSEKLVHADNTFTGTDIVSSGMIASLENILRLFEFSDDRSVLKDNNTAEEEEQDIVRLCFHGIAVSPQVTLTPTEIHLGETCVGACTRRVLIIENKCPSLPIHFSYQKTMCVEIVPSKGKLEALQKLEVAVNTTPVSIGAVKKNIKINLLGKSEPYKKEESALVALDHRSFLLTYNTVAKPKIPDIKFNLGITPKITHEVGLIGDGVTFSSPVSKPRAAMLKADLSKKRFWLQHDQGKKPEYDTEVVLSDVKKFIRTEMHFLGDIPKNVILPKPSKIDTVDKKTDTEIEETVDEISWLLKPNRQEEQMKKDDIKKKIQQDKLPSVSVNIIPEASIENIIRTHSYFLPVIGSQKENIPQRKAKSETRFRYRVVSEDQNRKPSKADPKVYKPKDSRTEIQMKQQQSYFQQRRRSSGSFSKKHQNYKSCLATSSSITFLKRPSISFSHHPSISFSSTSIGLQEKCCVHGSDIGKRKSVEFKKKVEYSDVDYPCQNVNTDGKENDQSNEEGISSKLDPKLTNQSMSPEEKEVNGFTDCTENRKLSKRFSHELKANIGTDFNVKSSDTNIRGRTENFNDESIQYVYESKKLSDITEISEEKFNLSQSTSKTCALTNDKNRSTCSGTNNNVDHSKASGLLKGLPPKSNKPINTQNEAKVETSPNTVTEVLKENNKIMDSENKVDTVLSIGQIENEIHTLNISEVETPSKESITFSKKENPNNPFTTQISKSYDKNSRLSKENNKNNEATNLKIKSDTNFNFKSQKRPTGIQNKNQSISEYTRKNSVSKLSPKITVEDQGDKLLTKRASINNRKLNTGKTKKHVGSSRGTSELDHRRSTLARRDSTDYVAEAIAVALKDLNKDSDESELDAVPPTEETKSTEVEASLVAFPNDRQRSIRPWPKDKLARTIFTGKLRYSNPVDSNYTLTQEEFAARKKNKDRYVQYIRQSRKGHKERHIMAPSKEEYAVSCPKLYQIEDLKIPKETETLTIEKIKGIKTIGQFGSLVNLTPLQLYNVKVNPHIIGFGKVAKNCRSSTHMSIQNFNSFPVEVQVFTGRTGVTLTKGDKKLLKEMETWVLHMDFCAESLGRYNGFIQYVVNGIRAFQVPVNARVVLKALFLTETSLVFQNPEQEMLFEPTFMAVGLINKLQAHTKFEWDIPRNSPFTVQPTTGTVPPLQTLQCCVKYTPDISKTISADMVVKSEDKFLQLLKCSAVISKATRVDFVHSKLEMKEIPLNLHTNYNTILYNGNLHEIMFKVLDSSPIPGIKVEPVEGFIKARSCLIFHFHCKIPVVIQFSFLFKVQLQKSEIKELKVTGSVGYPKVALKPNELRLRRISADSFDSIQMRMINKGTTIAKVEFNMDEYPEYHISESPDIYDFKSISPKYHIGPGEMKRLYLHFKPTDVATYQFALPVVINDILGPPIIEKKLTYFTNNYLRPEEMQLSKNIQPLVYPERIPFVKIECTVAHQILSISKLRVSFFHHPCELYNESRKVETVQVTNVEKWNVTFSINTESIRDPETPFTFVPETTVMIKKQNENIFEAILKPGQSVFLRIIFKPRKPGRHVTKLPIYVAGYESVYNNLYLEGLYPTPSLIVNAREAYFPPIPLGIESITFVTLLASFFAKETRIEAKIEPVFKDGRCVTDSIFVHFIDGNVITPKRKPIVLEVKMVFKSDLPTSFRTTVTFTDNESAECSMELTATADNCILSTYAFLNITSQLYHVTDESSHESDDMEEPIKRKEEAEALSKKNLLLLNEKPVRTYSKPKLNLRRIQSGLTSSHQIQYSSLSLVNDFESSSDYESFVTVFGPSSDDTIEESSSFPKVLDGFFPSVAEDKESSESAQAMLETLEAAENWLYEQGFQCTYNPRIPEGITVMLSGEIPISKSRVTRPHDIPSKTILDVLHNLAGTKIFKGFDIRALPKKPEERVEYQVTMYNEVIAFLTKQGACLAHVRPQYLLSYNDYLLFMKDVHTHSPNITFPDDDYQIFSQNKEPPVPKHILNFIEFQSRSKQCWLDIILQMHKTMVLSRINANNLLRRSQSISTTVTNISSHITMEEGSTMRDLDNRSIQSDDTPNSNVYSSHERVLLNWLDSTFKLQRLQYRTVSTNSSISSDSFMDPRVVSNFDKDLSDGLVFASVTASYCPYLVPLFFENLFLDPENEEQTYHNAVNVTMAWQTIKLGFTVKPEDIVKPNSVNMLLLTTYLFEMLPSFRPKRRLIFNAELNCQHERTITLQNPTDKVISYGIQILGNQQGFFSTKRGENTIHINARDKVSLTLCFNARKIGKSTATLIMCGNVTPMYYARNFTFSLEGDSSYLRVSEVFTLSPNIYVPTKTKLTIKPPYQTEAEYDIYVTEEEPVSSENLTAIPWKEIQDVNLPRRLFLSTHKLCKKESSLTVDLELTVICATTRKTEYWFVFKHPDVGDFIIKIVVTPDIRTLLISMSINLTPNWNAIVCSCPDPESEDFSLSCPLCISIKLPYRNTLFWEAIYSMLKNLPNMKEQAFWKKYVDKNIGQQLVLYAMGGDKKCDMFNLLKPIMNISVTYDVTCTNSKLIKVTSAVHIPDVRENNAFKLAIHVSNELKSDLIATIKLTSKDKMEVRNVRIQFLVNKSKTSQFEDGNKGKQNS